MQAVVMIASGAHCRIIWIAGDTVDYDIAGDKILDIGLVTATETKK
jgi:hypothetical protein